MPRCLRLREAGKLMLAAAFALGAAGCDSQEILDVPDPDVATPESVQDKAALGAVLAGAIGDFAVAYSGQAGTDGQISISALFTDEFQWAETFPTRQEVDIRSIQPTNGTMDGLFRNLQRARTAASRAADGFARFDPAAAGYGEALNLEGTTYNLAGENYCSGVPFSELVDGQPIHGNPLPRDSIFTRAIVRADSALRVLGASTAPAFANQRSFAQLVKGRALVNLGQHAAAATAVASVPTTFQYAVLHSENSARQHNGIYSLVYDGRRFTVGEREGGNGLPFRSEQDSRTPNARGTGSLANGFDGTTPLFVEQKYPARTSAVPVANGIEARLIEAEASLRGGNFAAALITLNTLRAGAGLTPLDDPGTAVGQEDMLFRERAYWLWLTSHRLGDMRRLVRQYGRNSETVFPTGTFFKGGTYGPDVNFPIPFDETNNPNFTACLDRNA